MRQTIGAKSDILNSKILIPAAAMPTLFRLKRLQAIWRGLRPAITGLALTGASTSEFAAELRDMRATLYLWLVNSHLHTEISLGGLNVYR